MGVAGQRHLSGQPQACQIEVVVSADNSKDSASPDLLKEVREWVDLLARSHYEDLQLGPIFQNSPFVTDESPPKLTKEAKDGYVFKWSDQAREARKNVVIPPGNWRSELKRTFAKFIDPSDLPPFDNWEETLAILQHRRKEASRKAWEKRGIEKRRRMIEKMPYFELCAQYGHLLRFQPTPFVIPEGEDLGYWVERIQKYIDLKAEKLQFRVKLFCFESQLVTGEKCLRLCRIHKAGEVIHKIDDVSTEVNEVFNDHKLLEAEKAFDYRKHLKEMTS